MMLQLVLGGARSGKSRFAEQTAQQYAQAKQQQLIYLATAQALDLEMQQRISIHQQQRHKSWQTLEEPYALCNRLLQFNQLAKPPVVLVDCLTLWITNCLLHTDKRLWVRQRDDFLRCLPMLHFPLFLVSNEVGQGIVPLGEINRQFVDEAGWLHQRISEQATKVSFLIAGCEQVLKNTQLRET